MTSREHDAFKVAVVLFVDGHLFSPRSSPPKVNQSIMPFLVDPSAIHKVNWCRRVLAAVKQASLKVKQALSVGKKSVSLDCCLIFLEVFYLDNLETGDKSTTDLRLPRVSDFPYDKIKNIISLDKAESKDGNCIRYGRLKIRASDQVIYSRGTGRVETSDDLKASTEFKDPHYVLTKLMELKADLHGCKMAYMDQVDMLVAGFEQAIYEYYKNRNAGSPPSVARYALVLDSMQDGVSQTHSVNRSMAGSPATCSNSLRTATSLSPTVGLPTPGILFDSPAANNYFSPGPTFDTSGLRMRGSDAGFTNITAKMESFNLLSPDRELEDAE